MLLAKKGMCKGATPLTMAYRLAAAVFIATLGVGVFAFAIPLLVFQENGSGLRLGAAFSGYFLAKLVISPVAGRLSDKTGPKPLLVTSAGIGLLAPLAAFFSLHHDILYAIQVCLGLSSGVMKPVATAAIAVVVPAQRRGRIFGLCNAGYNAAFFLGPILSGLIFYHRNLVPVLIFLAVCMAISLAVLLGGIPAELSTTPSDPAQEKTPPQKKKRRNGLLLLAICGRTAGTASLVAFYPALLSETLHGPAWLVGFLFAAPSLVACISLPLGGRLADKFDRHALAVAGMALSAVCLVFTGSVETLSGFLLTGLLLGLGSGLSFPACLVLASSSVTGQGTIMGWFHGAANAGFVIGPVLSGLLLSFLGELPLSMAAMGLLGLASTVPLAVFHLPRLRALSWRSVTVSILAAVIAVFALFGMRNGISQPPLESSSLPETSLNFAGVAMGNVVRMTLSGVDSETGGEASQAAFGTIARLEAEFGHRNGSGSVGRVNLAAGKAPVAVEPVAFALIQRALDICNASNGVFD
ncbi:MAG: hypothetical protein CR984_04160, partial [Proteobacteria bacterium]